MGLGILMVAMGIAFHGKMNTHDVLFLNIFGRF